jgi:hypothetical protein
MHAGLLASDGCFSSALTALIDILSTAQAQRPGVDPSIPAVRVDVTGTGRKVTTGAGLTVPVAMHLRERPAGGRAGHGRGAAHRCGLLGVQAAVGDADRVAAGPAVALAAAVGSGDPVIGARRSVWPVAGLAAPARLVVGAGGMVAGAEVAAGAAKVSERRGDRHVPDRCREGGQGAAGDRAGVDSQGKKVNPTMACVSTRKLFEDAGFVKATDTRSVSGGFPRVLMRLDLR